MHISYVWDSHVQWMILIDVGKRYSCMVAVYDTVILFTAHHTDMACISHRCLTIAQSSSHDAAGIRLV